MNGCDSQKHFVVYCHFPITLNAGKALEGHGVNLVPAQIESECNSFDFEKHTRIAPLPKGN